MPDDWEKEANKENPNYAQWIKEAAEREHIPVVLLARPYYKESIFKATAGSTAGAKGIAQLTPNALKEMNDDMGTEYNPKAFNYYDAKTSIDTGAAYLAHLHRKFGNWPAAVGSYNAGSTWMKKWRDGVAANEPTDETKTMLQRIFRTDPKAFGD
jgi:soluble lytic murein transglycosylase